MPTMMRIGLVSDTHVPDVASEIPKEIQDVFSSVDLILHAGNIYVTSVLDDLEKLAPVLAAEGDDDAEEIWRDRRVKQRHVLLLEGINLWLTHVRPWSWPSRLAVPNVVVHGHTHNPAVHNRDGVLFINPGSPTFPRYKYELGTVGLLTIDDGQTEVSLVDLRRGS